MYPGDQPYSFTFASTANGAPTVKLVAKLPDGSLIKRPALFQQHWRFAKSHSFDHHAMVRVLRGLAKKPHVMILLGQPVPGLDLDQPHPRRWARRDPGGNTLQAVERWWIPIDIDEARLPDGGDPARLIETARAVREQLLPPEFLDAAAIAAPTAGSGLKGDEDVRLRLFFASSRPVSLADLALWATQARAAGVPLDPSIYRAGQPIYTGRPIFHGMDDPVPEALHAFLLPGRVRAVTLDLGRYTPAAQPSHLAVKRRRQEAEQRGRPSDRWRAGLYADLGGTQGFNEPLLHWIGYAALSPDSAADIVDYADGLIGNRADDDRRAHYSRQWLAELVTSFRNGSKERRTA